MNTIIDHNELYLVFSRHDKSSSPVLRREGSDMKVINF
jgi:hypothetical protein